MAVSGSVGFPQRKPWSQEDSGSRHHLNPNSGGQSPRSPALGRSPKEIGENVHAWPTKWIICRRGNITREGKHAFTPAHMMDRLNSREDRAQNIDGVLWSEMCLGNRGVVATFRIQPATWQTHGFSLVRSECGSPCLFKGPWFSIFSPQFFLSPRYQSLNESSL